MLLIFDFKKLNYAQKNNAIQLLTQEFNASQPLTKSYLKKFPTEKEKSVQKWRKYWQLNADYFCSNDLSVGCFDMNNNGQLVGLVAVRDIRSQPEGYESQMMNDNIVSITDLLQKKLISLSEEKYHKLFTRKELMIFFIGGTVKAKHADKGLVSIMTSICEYLAASKGYVYSYAFTSNYKSAFITKKHHFLKISELDAKKFSVNGTYYYEYVENINKSNALWIKKLRNNPIDPKL